MARTKADLMNILTSKFPNLSPKVIDSSVRMVLDHMLEALGTGGRVEIRGFGTFCLTHRKAREGRNPKTGEVVVVAERWVPHFKPGKELRDRVNESRQDNPLLDND